MNTSKHTIVIPKSNVSLPTNMFIIEQIITPKRAINKYIPSFVKSILVKYPIKANIKNNKAVIPNTYIIDIISYITNIDENVSPVKNEYTQNNILAVIGCIFLILALKNITTNSSAIIKNQ